MSPGMATRHAESVRHVCATRAFRDRLLPNYPCSGGVFRTNILNAGRCFLTWHLHGSVPASRFPTPHNLSAGQAFVWLDRYLDTTRTGPLWLRREEIARLVVEAIQHSARELSYFDVEAYVVMANHVHMLVWPRVAAPKFLHSLKGYTAREANKILGRTGQPFWQKESYDHWVRDSLELERVRRYIEQNPVKAGLVSRAKDYPWSSAA